MRRFLFTASISTLLYFIWNISTTGFSFSAGWNVDWPYLFLGLLYWPAVFLAWMVGTIGLLRFLQARQRTTSIITIMLALPMLGYSLYYPKYSTMKKWHANAELKHGWWMQSQILNSLLMRYARENRDQLRWLGVDEEIDSSGFVAYLSSLPPSDLQPADGKGFRIKLTDKGIVSPWGCPVRFGVDRDGNGYLNLLGKMASLKPGYADPWGDGNFSYVLGVGCAPEAIYDKSAQYVCTLDDGTYSRIYESGERAKK